MCIFPFLRERFIQVMPHDSVDWLTSAIGDFVQASLEHGSVSLVLLAGGLGKRMGVRFLVSCTCIHLSDAVGYW